MFAVRFYNPHPKGAVTEELTVEQSSYNHQMVNTQIKNILENSGITSDELKNTNLTFTIDPYTFALKAFSGTDELNSKIELALNN